MISTGEQSLAGGRRRNVTRCTLTFGQHADDDWELDPQTIDWNPRPHSEQRNEAVGYRFAPPPAGRHDAADFGPKNGEGTAVNKPASGSFTLFLFFFFFKETPVNLRFSGRVGVEAMVDTRQGVPAPWDAFKYSL